MARTPAQRGTVGNWLVLSRIARGWDTQEKARTEIERLTGWRIAQSVYAEWESGRRTPSDANLARLQEFYGTTTALDATLPPADLVAALTAQTAAMDRQTARMGELVDILRELVAGRYEPAPDPPVGVPTP